MKKILFLPSWVLLVFLSPYWQMSRHLKYAKPARGLKSNGLGLICNMGLIPRGALLIVYLQSVRQRTPGQTSTLQTLIFFAVVHLLTPTHHKGMERMELVSLH